MERGEFRMNNLQEFYKLWESMKKSDINYEMWVKTIKLYDEKKYLHSVEGFRCCYKFGIMASDWKPFPHEILSNGGKGCFPNQATWNNSRFYKDFHVSSSTPTTSLPISSQIPIPSAVGANVTTLFTLRPLDNSASSFSEMEVMSDNTSIIKPNSPSKVLLSPPITSKIPTSQDKTLHPALEERKKDVQEKYSGDLVINCQIKFPKSKTDKVILRLDDGPFLELDRNIFSSVEQKLRNISTGTAPTPSIKTTIVHKDKTFKDSPSKKRKVLRKHKPITTGHGLLSNGLVMPVTPEAKKFPNILPKVSPEQSTFMKKDVASPSAVSPSGPLYTTMQNSDQMGKALPQTFTLKVLPSSLATPDASSASFGRDSEVERLLEEQKAMISRERDLDKSLENLQKTYIREKSLADKEDQLNEECMDVTDDEDDTVSVYSSDSEFESIYDMETNEAGDFIGTPKKNQRENVKRCKEYREKKKNELRQGEINLQELAQKNADLKKREAMIDASLEALHKTYFNLIKKNCDCAKEANDLDHNSF